MKSITRARLILAFFILAILWFFNLNHFDLLKPDEGRYAEIAREMAVTGDYITPRIDGIKYFEKPPLQYWATALSYEVFGPHNWTARLWTALCGFLTMLAVFFFARRYYSLERAVLATAVLASSLLFTVMSHLNTLDIGVSFFMTLIAMALAVLFSPGHEESEYKKANLVLWIAAALAFLSKGLMAFVLPGFAAVIFLLVRREWTVFKRIKWLWGIPLCLAILLPWVLILSQRHPEFARFFFIHEHFERFLTTSHHREGPWWFFLPYLLVGCFPWLFFIPRLKWNDPKTLFFLIWSLAIFSFFSASSSKLAPYVLPIWPSLALLAAASLDSGARPRDPLYIGASLALLALLFVSGSFYVSGMSSPRFEDGMFVEFSHWLLGVGAVLFVACLAVTLLKIPRLKKIVALAVTTLVASQILLAGYGHIFAPSVSSRVLSEALRPYITEQTPVYMVHYYEQELPFYMNRLVTLVEYQGELEFGIANEQTARYKTLGEFADEWRKSPSAVMIYEPHTGGLLSQQGINYKVIYQDKRRVAAIKTQ